jgi:hypothetical protein
MRTQEVRLFAQDSSCATFHPQGFLPPSRWFTPSCALPALFQAGSAYGVEPFGAFLLARVDRHFCRFCPACRHPQALLRRACFQTQRSSGPVDRLSGTSLGESLADSFDLLVATVAGCSRGLGPFQGFRSNASPDRLRSSSSLVLGGSPGCPVNPACTSES